MACIIQFVYLRCIHINQLALGHVSGEDGESFTFSSNESSKVFCNNAFDWFPAGFAQETSGWATCAAS